MTDEDIEAIVEIERQPQVLEWLYDYISPNAQKEFRDYQEFFRELPKNNKADILVAFDNKKVIGFLGLWRLGTYMEHVATIGVSVHPDYWRKGIATELIKSAIKLAEAKGIRRLEIETLAENSSMRNVAEKLGFKQESLRSLRVKKDGSYHDEVSYSMLL